jgi:hypothetical protein
MYSFAQIIDKNQNIDSLQYLGSRLQMPNGWRFNTWVLNDEFRVVCDGVGFITRDDLENTWVRV